ncbi:hypothetical protein KO481_24460 [Nocardia sp. NEAU-G5]|uniref:Uncharacterized protein n=1 Tax=Nocardia albiluteola TaxID=2842303 RepID=A0ABS6B2Z6_9NOCA|nr:hypothetical protein [Nocardia albiluteola]MBU3064672.1 hypothetical protein [Nocardia albiluteola]
MPGAAVHSEPDTAPRCRAAAGFGGAAATVPSPRDHPRPSMRPLAWPAAQASAERSVSATSRTPWP